MHMHHMHIHTHMYMRHRWGRSCICTTCTHTHTYAYAPQEAYVDRNIDIDKLFETGVNAMLSVLDPYSTFENPKEVEDLTVRTTGKYGGVGLTIGKDEEHNSVLVLGALEGFAYDAGVRPGDRIVAIDEAPTASLDLDAVKTKLRGEPGTTIQLTLERDGSPDGQLVVPLARKLVRLPDVTLATLQSGVGYLKLEGFSDGTAAEMARALFRMQLQAGGEMKALVLDLRDNPVRIAQRAEQRAGAYSPPSSHLACLLDTSVLCHHPPLLQL